MGDNSNNSSAGQTNGTGSGEGVPDDLVLLWHVGVIMICAGVVAFVLNLLAMLSILVNRRLRTVNAHVFIVNMATVDLLYSVAVIIPVGVWNYLYDWYGSAFHCQLQIYMEASLSYVSNLSVALVALDKYLFIAKPFRYESWMRPRTVVLLIGLSWFIPMFETIFITWLPVAKWETLECWVEQPAEVLQVQGVLFFLIPLLVIVICGALIVAIVRDHQRRIASLDVGAAGPQRVSWRAVSTVLLVVLCFLVMQAPLHMSSTIRSFCGDCFSYNVIYEFLYYPLYASALVNPLLYVFTDRKFRKSLFHFICCGKQTFLTAETSMTDSTALARNRSLSVGNDHSLIRNGLSVKDKN